MIQITRGTDDKGEPELTIKLNNGDLQAFDTAMNKWRFIDGVGMLRFIFAIMGKSQNNKVWVIDDTTGKQAAFEPVAGLLKPDDTTANGANSDAAGAQPKQPTNQ